MASVLAVVLAADMKTEPNQAHPKPSEPFRSLLFILGAKFTERVPPKNFKNFLSCPRLLLHKRVTLSNALSFAAPDSERLSSIQRLRRRTELETRNPVRAGTISAPFSAFCGSRFVVNQRLTDPELHHQFPE